VARPGLLLHELTVDQLVASPLLRESEEIGFCRRPIQLLRDDVHEPTLAEGRRLDNLSTVGAMRPARIMGRT
jgi:hypothetical protein